MTIASNPPDTKRYSMLDIIEDKGVRKYLFRVGTKATYHIGGRPEWKYFDYLITANK